MYCMMIFEHLYCLGYLIKKNLALKKQKKLPCRVISIGNITVGGTGKTPLTIALAEEARKRGFKPCILTRGYKGKARGPCFVWDVSEESLFGDEPVLIAKKLGNVPVVKCADRYKGGIFAIQNSNPQALFILDDGFQHWSLFRDKDILLIDGTNPFGNRRLLPFGPLREPLSEIRRADIIVITKTELATKPKNLIEEIRRYNSRAPIFFSECRPLRFITTTANTLNLEWAKGKKFFGFCGIGSPESFRKSLLSVGIELTGFKTYKDHYRYNLDDLETIVRSAKKCGADWIVTTEKDIMRLKNMEIPPNLVALVVEFSIEDRFYEEVFSGI